MKTSKEVYEVLLKEYKLVIHEYARWPMCEEAEQHCKDNPDPLQAFEKLGGKNLVFLISMLSGSRIKPSVRHIVTLILDRWDTEDNYYVSPEEERELRNIVRNDVIEYINKVNHESTENSK